jgi:hypothetical protein
MPQKRRLKEEKAKIETRQDFNRIVRSMHNFAKKGAEKVIVNQHGIGTTKWQMHEVKMEVRRINVNRANMLAKAKAAMGENPDMTGAIHTLEEASLHPKQINFDKKRSYTEWERFVTSAEHQIRENYMPDKVTNYKAFYLKAIDNQLGIYGEDLRNFVDMLPADFFHDNYRADDILTIDFTYDPQEAIDKANAVLEKWKEIAVEKGLINEEGHLIDEKGRLINKDGHLVDEEDNLVDEYGNLVDEYGNIINEVD